MNPIIESIYQQTKSHPKKIVLPEGTDDRVVQAAKIVRDQQLAELIVLGPKGDINPLSSDLLDQFAQNLFEIRQNKGLTLDQAHELVKNPLYFGTLMVHLGLADGLVAGAQNTTTDTLKPALQIVKNNPDSKLISTFFIIDTHQTNLGADGLLFFADCGLNINPNSEELAEIAIQTSKSFNQLTHQIPKIAMLSYSTNGSAQGETVDKVKTATKLIQEKYPHLIIAGDIQADAALVPEISQRKFPQNQLNGQANILIFPDLNSGNIAYKLVERISQSNAYGPLTQGINKPVNDLSRGCSIQDIITTIAITSIQAN